MGGDALISWSDGLFGCNRRTYGGFGIGGDFWKGDGSATFRADLACGMGTEIVPAGGAEAVFEAVTTATKPNGPQQGHRKTKKENKPMRHSNGISAEARRDAWTVRPSGPGDLETERFLKEIRFGDADCVGVNGIRAWSIGVVDEESGLRSPRPSRFDYVSCVSKKIVAAVGTPKTQGRNQPIVGPVIILRDSHIIMESPGQGDCGCRNCRNNGRVNCQLCQSVFSPFHCGKQRNGRAEDRNKEPETENGCLKNIHFEFPFAL